MISRMALRLWSRRATGLSHLLPSCQLLCNNLSTVKASSVASSAPEDGHAAALDTEPGPTSEKKKERLSRQERTALVESFVIKHMEAHGGAFPSVSVVLKETGGGRSAVKDILHGVESRFSQLTSRQTSSANSSAGRSTSDGIEENFGVGSGLNETLSGTSGDESDYGDFEGDISLKISRHFFGL